MLATEKRTVVVLGILWILMMALSYQMGELSARIGCLNTCLDVLEEGLELNEETVEATRHIPPYDMELASNAERVEQPQALP